MPEGTPHYPGQHLLGSSTWDDTNLDATYSLGELRGGPTSWENGAAPAVLPLAVIAGSRDCIADGELFEHALKDDALILGLPIACYRRPQDLDEGFLFLSDLKSCKTQKFFARVIQALYADDQAAALDLVAANVAGVYVATFHFATTSLPGCVTIVNANYACIICDGTRNLETFVTEALYSLAGPINFGRFSTMPLWYTAATWLTNWLTIDGADPTAPIIFAGHSYGGAAATVAAARSTFPPNGGPRFLFTIGCPRPGDLRLAAIIKTCQVINLANDDDIVTISPPSPELLWMLAGPIGNFVLEYWPNWQRVYNQLTQSPDGTIRATEPEDPDFPVLFDLVTRAIAHTAFDFFEPHYVAEYIARIVKRCPDDFAQVGLEIGCDVPDGRLVCGAEVIAVPGPDCENGFKIHLNETYHLQLKPDGGGWFTHAAIVGRRYTLTITQDYNGSELWGLWGALLDCVPSLGILNLFGTSSPFYIATPYSVDLPYTLNELAITIFPVAGVTINFTMKLTVERAVIMGAEDSTDVLLEDGTFLFVE